MKQDQRVYALLIDMDGKEIMNDEFVGIMKKFPKNAFIQDAGKYTQIGWYVFVFVDRKDAEDCKQALREHGYTVRTTNEPAFVTKEQYDGMVNQK